jgi:arginine utilization protein RocB
MKWQTTHYTLVLNSEPMFPRYPGDQTNYVYTGSIGKILPGFYCYGKETHVGESLAGLN